MDVPRWRRDSVCSFGARGVCRYLSQRYPHYKELYPFDFIRMTETSEGRAVPYRGMTYTDYCKILSEFGTFPIVRFVQKKGMASGLAVLDADAFEDSVFLRGIGIPRTCELASAMRRACGEPDWPYNGPQQRRWGGT